MNPNQPNQSPPPVTSPWGFPAVLPVSPDDRQRILPRDLATSGMLPGNTDIQVNGNNIIISGRNRNIIINDGTNNRVLIGYSLGGF